MKPVEENRVAVLIATARRSHLLASRALPSVGRQTRIPWRVVVVDDSRSETAALHTDQSVRAWRPAGIAVDFLRNRRTKGACGAWNSGLDHLLRTCSDPRRLYVAILDDDDGWEPDHLECCLALAECRGLDMVASPFLRIEKDTTPLRVIPPLSLRASDFLVGNPGIQGSNLVCRLSVLLEAGLFDESLPSCTDRDLCIRISELPGVRYGATAHPTVHHFACRSRPRLSTAHSPSRLRGLDRFFRKHNVWQHLRSFRKRLFDAVPEEALRLDGEYVDIASDWAFMLPIVEMAAHPVHITEPLYLYEPSGTGKGAGRADREATIARIVAGASAATGIGGR